MADDWTIEPAAAPAFEIEPPAKAPAFTIEPPVQARNSPPAPDAGRIEVRPSSPYNVIQTVLDEAKGGAQDVGQGVRDANQGGFKLPGEAALPVIKGAFRAVTSPITALSRAAGQGISDVTGGWVEPQQAETALMGLGSRAGVRGAPRPVEAAPKAAEAPRAPTDALVPPELTTEGMAAERPATAPQLPLKENVTQVADDLNRVRQTGVADRAEVMQHLEQVPPQFRTPEVQERWYHAIENPKLMEVLPPEERAAFDAFVQPMRQEINELYQRVKGSGWEGEDPNYVHRIAKGHAPQYDTLSGASENPVTGTRSLNRTTSALQERKYYAVEDAQGNRTVVSKNPDGSYVWKDGKPIRMTQDVKLQPGTTENIHGHPFKVTQATTAEIEASTPTQYHKSAAVNTADALVRLREVARNVEYLEKLKLEMQAQGLAAPIQQGGRVPEGFVRTKIPQLQGTAFEPKIAAVLDDFYKPGIEGLQALRPINQIATGSIFWNPLPHIENVAAHWFTGRGWDWIRPGPVKGFTTDAGRAIREVVTQGPEYRRLLKEGSGLVYGGVANGDFYRMMGQRFGMDIERNWGSWKPTFDKLRLKTPYEATAWWYDKMRNVLWAANDMFMVHRVFELERKGMSARAAIKEAERHIPNYRIPSEVLGSRTFSTILQEPAVTIFSRYHYGMWKSYMNMVGDMAKGAPKEKVEALGNLAALGVLLYAIYPAVDTALQMVTGDDKAEKLRRGSGSIPTWAKEMYHGDLTFPQFLSNTITLSPALKEGGQQFTGKDWFTGQDLGGSVNRAEHAGKALISPYNTAAQLVDSRSGTRTPQRTMFDTMIGAKNTSDRTTQGRERAKMFRARADKRLEMNPPGPLSKGVKKVKEYFGVGD